MIFSEKPDGFAPQISVVACYVQFNGNFILLQRQPSKTHGGKWGLPAGKIDPGEDDYAAVIREVYEETGIKVNKGHLKKLKTLWVENEGHEIEYHTFILTLTAPTKIVLSDDEHQAYRWTSPEKSLAMDLVHDLEECTKLFFNL
jgi:8-oxo-dGTP diphosphatase